MCPRLPRDWFFPVSSGTRGRRRELDVGIRDFVATRFPIFPDFRGNGPLENSRNRHSDARRWSAPGDAKKCGGYRSLSQATPSGIRRQRPPIRSSGDCGRTGNPIEAWNTSLGSSSGRARLSYRAPRSDVGFRNLAATPSPVLLVFLANGPRDKTQISSDGVSERSAPDDASKPGACRSKFGDRDTFTLFCTLFYR
ncbi:hypothetical protein EVAR_9927_1 [Eumeta japonica]|uniref:Uncharacterized protein n=1 Tax=Eumeta variegata TaxID=151549 RepID=A0A4C1TQY9_EUMVA|nr:hypothetical protein EVAR_9927_1 [Eumeta japonica]